MRKLAAEILWFCILLALILIFGYLLIGGDVLLFLAPRMLPMVWFGFAVLIVLYGYQSYQILWIIREKRTHGLDHIGMLLFLAPVVLLITAMPDASTSATLPNQNVKMISISQTQNVPDMTGDDAQEADTATKIAPSYESIPVEDLDQYKACVLQDSTAYFRASADEFSKYLQRSLEDLIGKTITVYGYVYREDAFPADTVLVARMMVTCCAADAWIAGFHVKLDPDIHLDDNQWVKITGTVRSFRMEYYDEPYDFPILTDGIIEKCDAPKAEDAYLYP